MPGSQNSIRHDTMHNAHGTDVTGNSNRYTLKGKGEEGGGGGNSRRNARHRKQNDDKWENGKHNDASSVGAQPPHVHAIGSAQTQTERSLHGTHNENTPIRLMTLDENKQLMRIVRLESCTFADLVKIHFNDPDDQDATPGTTPRWPATSFNRTRISI